MKSQTFSGSIGSQLTIAQEQIKHQEKLDRIYNKRSVLSSMTVNEDYLIMSTNRNPSRISKRSFNEQMNHHLTIRHLIQRLNCPKTYNQRLKDSNDFLAYPALFFRNNDNQVKKKKALKQKNKQSNNSQYGQLNSKMQKISKHHELNNQSQLKAKETGIKQKSGKKGQSEQHSFNSRLSHNGLTTEKVAMQLPYLKKFQQEDIQNFSDSLTQIIFKYNLDKMEDVQFLFSCVEKYLPQHYPEHFINAIEDIFKEIVNSLNIQQ